MQASFNTTDSETASIDVGFSEKVSISGNVSYGTSVGTGNQISIGSAGFEYCATPIVLQATFEAGTYTTSGGFGISRIVALWRFLWEGLAGLVPRIDLKRDDSKTRTIYIKYGWMICKKACA